MLFNLTLRSYELNVIDIYLKATVTLSGIKYVDALTESSMATTLFLIKKNTLRSSSHSNYTKNQSMRVIYENL